MCTLADSFRKHRPLVLDQHAIGIEPQRVEQARYRPVVRGHGTPARSQVRTYATV